MDPIGGGVAVVVRVDRARGLFIFCNDSSSGSKTIDHNRLRSTGDGGDNGIDIQLLV